MKLSPLLLFGALLFVAGLANGARTHRGKRGILARRRRGTGCLLNGVRTSSPNEQGMSVF
jgi:hypothetical protein